MRKAWFALFIAVVLVAVSLVPAYAYEVRYGFAAEELWNNGLFLGSDGSFDLDQPLTRVEGVTMIVRLLGKDKEAKEKKLSHPFTDVPSWADPYVGYCYAEKISNGISATEFGSTRPMTAAQYITLVLRALGYQDGVGKDFIWDKSPAKALEIGLIGDPCYEEYTTTDEFRRDNAAVIAYSALYLKIKGTENTLASTITMPGKPEGSMPSYTKTVASSTGAGQQSAGGNKGNESGTKAISLKEGHSGGINGANVTVQFLYMSGVTYGAEWYTTLYTGDYSGPLQIAFSSVGDTRDITVEANSTYAITYTYTVKKDSDTVIKNPDTQIPAGIDPVTGTMKYTTIPGTVTRIPAVTRDVLLDIQVSGGASAELSTKTLFAGTFGKGSFNIVKVK